MLNKTATILLAGWIITIGFSVMAWGDGAPAPPTTGVPQVREYPLIQGTFTVGYRKSQKKTPEFFDIHVVLKRKSDIKMYSIERSVTTGSLDICKYKNETMDDLINKYKWEPTNQKVVDDFGLQGIPVITELKILESNHCDDEDRAMLYGTLKIRVLPSP